MSGTPARIWLCADDYGISPSVSAAIRDLIARGRINATSVMVVAPSFRRDEAIALDQAAAGARRAAIGLHVTLTAPYRPLSAGYAPTRTGAFLSLPATFARAFMRRFEIGRLADEIAAQLDAFIAAFGRAPDFFDGHQHVQLLPQVRDALLATVKQKAPHAWMRQCGRTLPFLQRFADRKGLLLDVMSRAFRIRAAALGLRTNAAFAGTYDFTDAAAYEKLFPQFLNRLPEHSVVMCHPGHVDDELRRVDRLTTLREREYAYFASDDFPAVLAAHGIALAAADRARHP
jgi:predicted glycoside hydrolase/deacetylase ChbG (UPF0249 family)